MKKLFLLLLSVILVTLVSCAKDDLETESSILWFTNDFSDSMYIGISWKMEYAVDGKWDMDMSNIPLKLFFSEDGIYDKEGNWTANKKTSVSWYDNRDITKDLYKDRIFGYQIITGLNNVLYSGVIPKIWENGTLSKEESEDKYISLNVSFPEFIPIFYYTHNRYIIPEVYLCLVVVDTISDLEVSKFPILEAKNSTSGLDGYFMSMSSDVLGDSVLLISNFSELFYYRYFSKYGIQVSLDPFYYYILEDKKQFIIFENL
jgi:hypothetical protein